MIKIDLQEPTDAAWQQWRLTCGQKQAAHNALRAVWQPSKVNNKLYKGQKEQVYLNKDGPFYGKCAYCEADLYSSQHGDIEHFRPKNRITDDFGKPEKITVGGVEREHPGYYWLAYDWKNLLPACQLCNQPNTQRSDGRLIGKRDYFPLAEGSPRALQPGEETQEQPLLIHPVWEDPTRHLKLDESGVMASISPRGTACIEILGLNDRDLPNKRKQKFKDIRRLLRELFNEYDRNPNSDETRALLKEVMNLYKGKGEYTMAARLAIKKTAQRHFPLVSLLLDL